MRVEYSHQVLLPRLVLVCALLVISILGISAFIRLSGAGLGCSPWPQCFGHVATIEQQGILQTAIAPTSVAITVARFTHRILAVLLLPLMLVLVFGGFSMKPTPWSERWVAVLALGLVLFLAVLGRWTAGVRVPAVTLGNLLGGFMLFALCWRMACGGSQSPVGVRLSGRAYAWTWIAALLLLIQIALGGYVSSTFAGLSCPNLYGCDLPNPVSWNVLNPMREPTVHSTNWPVNSVVALVHALHRWTAAAAALAIVGAAILLLGTVQRFAGLFLIALTGIQLALGLLLVHQELALALAIAHNVVAALMLAFLLGIKRVKMTD